MESAKPIKDKKKRQALIAKQFDKKTGDHIYIKELYIAALSNYKGSYRHINTTYIDKGHYLIVKHHQHKELKRSHTYETQTNYYLVTDESIFDLHGEMLNNLHGFIEDDDSELIHRVDEKTVLTEITPTPTNKLKTKKEKIAAQFNEDGWHIDSEVMAILGIGFNSVSYEHKKTVYRDKGNYIEVDTYYTAEPVIKQPSQTFIFSAAFNIEDGSLISVLKRNKLVDISVSYWDE